MSGRLPRVDPRAAAPGQKLDICPDFDPGPGGGPVGAKAPGPPHIGPGFAPGLPRDFRTRVNNIGEVGLFLSVAIPWS